MGIVDFVKLIKDLEEYRGTITRESISSGLLLLVFVEVVFDLVQDLAWLVYSWYIVVLGEVDPSVNAQAKGELKAHDGQIRMGLRN